MFSEHDLLRKKQSSQETPYPLYTSALQSKRASLGLIASCFETLCTFCLVTEEILLLTFFICLSITDKQVCWEHLLAHSQSCWH